MRFSKHIVLEKGSRSARWRALKHLVRTSIGNDPQIKVRIAFSLMRVNRRDRNGPWCDGVVIPHEAKVTCPHFVYQGL